MLNLCMWFLLMLDSCLSSETADSIVIRGTTAHLWCNFDTSSSSSSSFSSSSFSPFSHGARQVVQNPTRRMIYSSNFRPSLHQDQLVWAQSPPQSPLPAPEVEPRPRFRTRHNSSHLSLDIVRVQFQDAGTYSCVDDESRIVLRHNLVVIGGSVRLEKSFESYDRETHSDRFYLVPEGVQVRLICSLELSQTHWGSRFPTLEISGASHSDRRRYGHTLVHTYLVNASRSGEYTCSANFPDSDWSPLRPASIFVVVNDNDQSRAGHLRHVIRYAANHGESLVLSCSSRFDSNDNWKWFQGRDHDSHDIALPVVDCVLTRRDTCENLSASPHMSDLSTGPYSLLTFPALDYASSGRYSCADSLLTVQKLFEVIVLDAAPPSVLVDGRAVDDNSTQVFRQNQWVYIACTLRHYINSSLNASLRLVVPNATLYNTSVDGMTFTYRVLMVNSRPFTCRIDLPDDYRFYGERKYFTFFANVLHCPDGIRISGNASRSAVQRGGILNCVTSAEPPVNVSWDAYASNVVRFLSGPNFASLMVQETGDYRCRTERTISPVLGSCSALYATIRIDQLLNEPRSKFVRIGAVRGRSFSIRCSSHHLRNTNWKWFRNWNLSSSSLNLPIVDCPLHESEECSNHSIFPPVGDRSNAVLTRLTFRGVGPEHAGNYTCVDSLRTVEKTFDLRVLECPGAMTVSKLNWERPYGQGKELMCSVSASPAMNVTWSFRNQSQISISGWNSARMPVFQSGTYECTVDVDHRRVLGSCGSLFSRVRVEDGEDDGDAHHEIED